MSSEPKECGVCRSIAGNVRIEYASDMNANTTEIQQCRNCLAVSNGRAYSLIDQSLEIKDIQRTDFYVPETRDASVLRSKISGKGYLLNYLFSKISRDWSKSVFCDFGGGDGLVSIAAADVFKSSILCDMDTRSVHEICGAVGYPQNLRIVSELAEVGEPIDVMFMWHVLEHIPRPAAFLQSIKQDLSKNCIFFMQCPSYRKDYLVDCHYTFFNEPSFEALFGLVGIRPIEISFDLENSFITALGVMEE